jgi:cell division protein FtsB
VRIILGKRKRVTVVLPRPHEDFWDARPAEPDADNGQSVPPEIERRDRIRHRVVVFVVSAIVVAGMVAALFGERGFLDVRRSRDEYRQLRHDVRRQFDEVRALREEVQLLQNDPTALERNAREELGFGREGEIQLLFPRTEQEQ